MFTVFFLSLLACFGKKKDLPNGYSREFVDTFVEECKADGGTTDQCECTVAKVMEALPASDPTQAAGNRYNQASKEVRRSTLSCMSEEQMQEQMMNGCRASNGTEEFCQCSTVYVMGRFNKAELVDIFMQISEDQVPAAFIQASNNAGLECMNPEDVKQGFVNSCAQGGDPSECECVYQELLSEFGEADLKMMFYRIGIGEKPAAIYEAINRGAEKCSGR